MEFQGIAAGHSWIAEATGENRFRGARIGGKQTPARFIVRHSSTSSGLGRSANIG
jgi:hypothetical protein